MKIVAGILLGLQVILMIYFGIGAYFSAVNGNIGMLIYRLVFMMLNIGFGCVNVRTIVRG